MLLSLRFFGRLPAIAMLVAVAATSLRADEPKPKKIVLIAGTKSHGPGHHEYELGMRVIKHGLDTSPNAPPVKTEVHLHGWPTDESTLDDADTIVLFSDGSDHDVKAHPILHGDRLKTIEKQMQRGCGLVAIHYTVFVPVERGGPEFLEWVGGLFDYQTGSTPNRWFSKIQHAETDTKLPSPDHPIARGLTPFKLREEYYYNIRFRENDQRRTPILITPIPGEPQEQTVAWTVERDDGGRGFAFTGGHFHDNWGVENYRRMLLNAVLWTAKAEVPDKGVQSTLPGQPAQATGKKDESAKVLIVTGHQYPGHPWRETTKSIERSLGSDKRLQVDVAVDPEFLAKDALSQYQCIILNYCNWERAGLSDESKQNFVEYLSGGGGLVIVHFANGAFHFSLPNAGQSDWPEFRKICRRVWDHTGGKSAHDAYGAFRVDIANTRHPITQGLQAFDTTDELYFNQQGDEPIEVLATGRSKITGKDEPLAFVYSYGKGRVFQTLLGHDAASLDAVGAATLVRRATAWTAGLDIQPEPPLNAALPKQVSLAPGRYGNALDARSGVLAAAQKNEYSKLPITVECWARLASNDQFNVIVAANPKESADHWELYSYAGSGDFSVFMPGYTPAEIRSGVDITDDRWHYLAMTCDGKKMTLHVDGKRVKEAVIERAREEGPMGPLWFGGYAPGGIGCNGLVDEVRISKTVRPIGSMPDVPFGIDAETIGLWHLDALTGDAGSPDDSLLKNAAVNSVSQAKSTTGDPNAKNHFGREVVGFDWTEEDSRDNRWNQTEVGSFLAASFPCETGPVLKGLAIRLGEQGEAAVCYDTGQHQFRAGWTGGFLTFDPARFGLIAPPRFAGEVQLVGANKPAFGKLPAQYRGLSTSGRRTVLHFEIDGATLLESPWIEKAGSIEAFSREYKVTANRQPLRMPVCLAKGEFKTQRHEDVSIATVQTQDEVIAAAVRGHPGAKVLQVGDELVLDVPVSNQPIQLKLLIWKGPQQQLPGFVELAIKSAEPLDLEQLSKPGSRRWEQAVITQGVVGTGDGSFVVDTLTLPFDNPYKALLFTSGHDFLSSGEAAVCTVHGDVWIVSGIDADLDKLTWGRFATGLYQPLGLKIVDDKVYVLGRDQITLLHDRNGDGEADFYECFSNRMKTSAEGHDYSACLEADPQGNFIFISAAQGIVRVSRDGQRTDVIAEGLRNPNGLAVGPNGVMTASPQEGNWTPASCIVEAREGGYYGFGGPRPGPDRPLGYDTPLCWLPRHIDNSSGGQVWVTGEAWKPLVGQLLHFSYGRCSMLLALRENVDGTPQGGVVNLPVQFESGAMRGRFSPLDGQLYVTGLKGWVSSAAQDGCFQRVRFTGKKTHLPTGIQTLANGVRLSFSEPLQREAAEDPDSYYLEQWNYRWTADYGSADYKVSDPKQEGHDVVEVRSVTLMPDGRSVFLEIDGLQPVMQMSIQLKLQAADGQPIEHTVYSTINRLPAQRIEPMPGMHIVRRGLLDDGTVARLRPGLMQTFRQSSGKSLRVDARAARLAALHVPRSEAPSAALQPGPFDVEWSGFIQVAIKDQYRFAIEGNGEAELTINDQAVDLATSSSEMTALPATPLHKGYNRISLRYRSPERGDANVRLLWSSTAFRPEPISPAALWHDSGDKQLARDTEWRAGRELFVTHGCTSCHQLEQLKDRDIALAEKVRRAPSLERAGERLSAAWIAAWIQNPKGLRHDATMPRLLHGADSAEQAADIAAYLSDGSAATTIAVQQSIDDSLVSEGERLYETLGCIGCHQLGGERAMEESRVTLDFIRAKFKPDALSQFLRRPEQHHPGTRMPNFRLNEGEASALAAFLLGRSSGDLPDSFRSIAGNPERGRELFETVGCQQCHEHPQKRAISTRQITLANASSGCLANPSGKPGVPAYDFSDGQRTALKSLIDGDHATLTFDPHAEAATRLVETLRCTTCHARDGQLASLPLVLQEEGSLGLPIEQIPHLTWAGEKLHADWTRQLLAGDRTHQSRPWLAARMPAFPAYADVLAKGLALQHGVPAINSPSDPSPHNEAIEIGRQLTLKDAGLDCRQCHALDRSAVQQNHNAQGIGFLEVKDRMRREFYERWVFDPLHIDPGTKMPKFSLDGKTTAVKHIYGGQARPQFDALWQYIQSLEAPPSTSQVGRSTAAE